MSSSESKLVVPTICERSSISELMSFVRSSFRQEEYDEVERLLISREEKLEMELRILKRDYDSYLERMLASLQRDREKKWKFAADMLPALDKDYELCMNAVCALYRKKISAEKSLMKSSLHTDLVFSHFDAMSGKQLAEFLIDGDPQYRLKRSVPEVQQKDAKVLSQCKDLAIQYCEKLFEIYHKAEDPFFRPKF